MNSLRHLLRNRFSKLVLAVIAFSGAYLLTLSFSENSSKPGISEFEKTLHKKENELNKEVDALVQFSLGKTFDQIFRQRPKRYNSLFHDQGMVLLIYESDTLKFWSDNSVSVENYMKEICLDDRMVKLKNGWFEVIRKTDDIGRTIIGMLLIKNEYSYQNQYLVNSFEPDFKMSAETEIAIGNPSSANSVHDVKGNYLFSLVFKSTGPLETPTWITWLNLILNLCGFVLLLLFIHSESFALTPVLGRTGSLLLFVGTVVVMRFLSLKINFPATFYELPLFGPKYYGNADSFWLSNLGDFLINALLLLVAVLLAAVAVWQGLQRRALQAVLAAAVAGAALVGFLTIDELPPGIVSFTPHLTTLLVLSLASQRLRMPKADGLVYRRGEH